MCIAQKSQKVAVTQRNADDSAGRFRASTLNEVTSLQTENKCPTKYTDSIFNAIKRYSLKFSTNFPTFWQNASLKRCRYSGSSLGLLFSTSSHLMRKYDIFRTSMDDLSILSFRSFSIIFCASAST